LAARTGVAGAERKRERDREGAITLLLLV